MIWSLVNYVPIQGSEKKIDFKACSLGIKAALQLYLPSATSYLSYYMIISDRG